MTGPKNKATEAAGCWCPDLKGKSAIITGAGRLRGMGRLITLELARQGVNVVPADIELTPARQSDEEKEADWRGVETLAEEARTCGVNALPVDLDISDPASVDDVVAAVTKRFGQIDLLINNAAAGVGADRAPIAELRIAEWDRVMQINLRGTFLMARAVASSMITAQKGGVIINISSSQARRADPGQGPYVISKAGIAVMSRMMALELAPHGIRVNTVVPGLSLTAMVSEHAKSESWDDFVKRSVPLGVMGDGTEVASMCTYLCSERAAWITGQDFGVDGGSSWR